MSESRSLRGLLQRIPPREARGEPAVCAAQALQAAAAAMAIAEGTPLSGVERVLADDAIIVSKTDPQGRIVYANDTFLEIAGYTEAELLGAPHSILRHPAMPRSVFAFLWQRLEARREVYAVVLNRAKNGDHYWVHAHVTPSIGPSGAIRGHHSFRRKPPRSTVDAAEALYRELIAVESRGVTKGEQVRLGLEAMRATFGDLEAAYDRWSWKAAP